MNELLREHAPISSEAWSEIDEEARRTPKRMLAARRLVDFKGPLGWSCSSVSTGRHATLSPSLQDGVVSKLRLSLPFIEIRIPFEVDREELDAIGRGDTNPDLDSVRNAARHDRDRRRSSHLPGLSRCGLSTASPCPTPRADHSLRFRRHILTWSR